MLTETLKFLAHAGQAAPSADNSQPWQFSWDGDFFTISLTENDPASHSLSKDHPAMLLALGCACENILQALQSIGMTNIQPQFLSEGFSIRFKLNSEIPVYNMGSENEGIPLFKRHTNRFPFQKAALSPNTKNKLLHLYENEAKIHVYDTPEQFDYWAQQVKKASEARFQSRDIHEWLGNSLRLSEREVLSNDGLDANTLDLPPGGKQLLAFTKKWSRMKFLNNFGLYKFFALVESLQIKKASCLLCISAPLQNNNIVDAGILMERVWIYLNNNGLSVHPYFVLSDQIYRYYNNLVPKHLVQGVESLVKNIEAQGFGKDNHLQMILRVGKPTIDPPLSRRHLPRIDHVYNLT